MRKILIADDHAMFREGLRRILEGGEFAFEEAKSGPAALEMALKGVFDLMLLDISLPGMDGLEVLKQLRVRRSRLPVLILSMYPEDQYALRAIKAGADGYLTKESASEELLRAIEYIGKGKKYITAAVADRLAEECAGKGKNGDLPHQALSDREFQIMCMIGYAKRITAIADQLSLSVKTVWTYRAKILDKMGMKTNAEIIRYVIERKLIE